VKNINHTVQFSPASCYFLFSSNRLILFSILPSKYVQSIPFP